MSPRATLKTFSALSFDAGQVTDGTVAAIPDSQPRLTPESVPDLPVQPDRSGRNFREILHERATTPYRSASPYQRCGINE